MPTWVSCHGNCMIKWSYWWTRLYDVGQIGIRVKHHDNASGTRISLLIDDSGNSWTLKGISSHTMGLEGICWNVPIKIGGIEFSHNFFMTRSSLGNKDMVLGQPWLFSQLTWIDYVHEMGVTLQLWENGDRKGRSILINLPLVKAPRNIMPIRFHHGYESYSAESTEIPKFKLVSLGTDPSSAKVPIFMSWAIDALQIGEYKSEKQWPDGINEDLILELSLSNPFISQIMKCTWFMLANNAAEMTLSKWVDQLKWMLGFCQYTILFLQSEIQVEQNTNLLPRKWYWCQCRIWMQQFQCTRIFRLRNYLTSLWFLSEWRNWDLQNNLQKRGCHRLYPRFLWDSWQSRKLNC